MSLFRHHRARFFLVLVALAAVLRAVDYLMDTNTSSIAAVVGVVGLVGGAGATIVDGLSVRSRSQWTATTSAVLGALVLLAFITRALLDPASRDSADIGLGALVLVGVAAFGFGALASGDRGTSTGD